MIQCLIILALIFIVLSIAVLLLAGSKEDDLMLGDKQYMTKENLSKLEKTYCRLENEE